MPNNRFWGIREATGGFTVDYNEQPTEQNSTVSPRYETLVFADSSALLNYLHNSFVGE